MEYLQPYLDYFSQHPAWATAIVFLIAFGEALLIIGLFVPSTAVLIGGGMLVGTGRLVIVLLVLLIVIAIAGWLIRLFVGGLAPWIEFGQLKLSRWARARPGKWWRRFGRAISPANPRAIIIIVFAAVAITSLFAFIRLISGIFTTGTLLNADISVHNMMKSVRSTPGDEFMIVITMFGDGVVMLALAVAMIGWLLLRRAWRAAVAVAVTLFSARLFVQVMQVWIRRERPFDFEGLSDVFGFPGHTAIATVTLGVLAVLVSHSMRHWGKAI